MLMNRLLYKTSYKIRNRYMFQQDYETSDFMNFMKSLF